MELEMESGRASFTLLPAEVAAFFREMCVLSMATRTIIGEQVWACVDYYV